MLENKTDRTWSGVLLAAEQDLGCAIPQRDNLHATSTDAEDGARSRNNKSARLTSCVYVRTGTPNARARPKSASFSVPDYNACTQPVIST